MTDEPTLGELKRTLETFQNSMRTEFANTNARLAELVHRDVYASDQRRLDERISEASTDLAKEELERKAGDDKQQKQLDDLKGWLKWLAAGVVLPSVGIVLEVIFKGK